MAEPAMTPAEEAEAHARRARKVTTTDEKLDHISKALASLAKAVSELEKKVRR